MNHSALAAQIRSLNVLNASVANAAAFRPQVAPAQCMWVQQQALLNASVPLCAANEFSSLAAGGTFCLTSDPFA